MSDHTSPVWRATLRARRKPVADDLSKDVQGAPVSAIHARASWRVHLSAREPSGPSDRSHSPQSREHQIASAYRPDGGRAHADQGHLAGAVEARKGVDLSCRLVRGDVVGRWNVADVAVQMGELDR
ncbi:hypothetical protein GCM10010176_105720 [Nonomuraea spiralis]|nr:hypothetical protein GCM10010176_105720 [Nonomuraea spiralis]